MKMFTKSVDQLLSLALSLKPGDPVGDQSAAMDAICKCRWSVKAILSFEPERKGDTWTRDAQTSLQVLSVNKVQADWTGGRRPLMTMNSGCAEPGAFGLL